MASWTDRPAPGISLFSPTFRSRPGRPRPVHGLGTRAPRVTPAPPPALLPPGEAERPGAFARVEA